MAKAGTNWMLMTAKLADKSPTLAEISKASGLPISELDEGFGVVPVDREQGLFAFQAREGAIATKKKAQSDVKGPFSNVKIEPLN